MRLIDELSAELAQLDQDGLRRRHQTVDSPCQPASLIDGCQMLAFCSNDYLGLANDPRLVDALCAGARQWGAGSGASHLVSGHLRPHADLEQALAAFVGFPAALLFSTGYMANLAVLPALAGRNDAVFADRLNHASLIDAAILARAEHHRYPHNDVAALDRLLAASTARRKIIVTDTVFSMDGDLAPLPELLELAGRHDALLVVDDAHGFGVLGPQGRGTVAHFGLPADPRLVLMGTLGKAAGVSGAFVAAHPVIIDWLLQRARTHIFTTAAPPALSVALGEALHLIAEADDRRGHLESLIVHLRTRCAALPWPLMPSQTAIQPLVVGDNHRTLALAAGLRERGIWVPAIRPPTVPAGQARLRISLSAAHRIEDVDALVDALESLA